MYQHLSTSFNTFRIPIIVDVYKKYKNQKLLKRDDVFTIPKSVSEKEFIVIR